MTKGRRCGLKARLAACRERYATTCRSNRRTTRLVPAPSAVPATAENQQNDDDDQKGCAVHSGPLSLVFILHVSVSTPDSVTVALVILRQWMEMTCRRV